MGLFHAGCHANVFLMREPFGLHRRKDHPHSFHGMGREEHREKYQLPFSMPRSAMCTLMRFGEMGTTVLTSAASQ